MDPILCRVAIFKISANLERVTVCPRHRGKLGMGQEERQDAEYPLIYPTTEKAAIKPGQKQTEYLENMDRKWYFRRKTGPVFLFRPDLVRSVHSNSGILLLMLVLSVFSFLS